MKRLLSVTAVIIAASANISLAQNPVLSEVFGRGVHKYFAGDLQGAHESLTQAIEAGSEDPRAYYFRGLVNAATGRTDEAESDYRTGAQYEVNSPMAGLVGQSLRRIQGSNRLELEKVRQEVRLQQRGNVNAAAQAKAQELRQVEPQVLRQGRGAAGGAAGMAPGVGGAAGTDNPFRAGAAPAAPQVVNPDALKDPFADDPANPSTPAPAGNNDMPAPAADPFGAPSAAPAADPFGAPEPAAGGAADPFAPAPAGGAAPAPAAGGAADPFADPFK